MPDPSSEGGPVLAPEADGRPDEFAMMVEEIVRNPMHNGRAVRLDARLILSAGAYTSSYSSVGFNGFAPLKTYCI